MTLPEFKEWVKTQELDDVLKVLTEVVREHREEYIKQPNANTTVIGCLIGCEEGLSHAAFTWYASFK